MNKLNLLIFISILLLSLNVFAFTWNETTPASSSNRNWTALDISSNGKYIVTGYYGGRVYLSKNAGYSWAETQPAGNKNSNWTSITMSSDGNVIIAADRNRLYLSTNNGVSWAETQPVGNGNYAWLSTAVDPSGSYLLAGLSNSGSLAHRGRLYLSSNGGSSWSEVRPAGDTNQEWITLAISKDIWTMAAGIQNGAFYISQNAGSSWSNMSGTVGSMSNLSSLGTTAVSMSEESQAQHILVGTSTGVFLSSNYGSSFMNQYLGNMYWYTTALNSDGTIGLAGNYQSAGAERLYLYSNGGWAETQPAGNNDKEWNVSAINSDGNMLVAGVYGGRLYIGSTLINTVSSGCATGWNNTAQNITLTCANGSFNCSSTTYRVDLGAWQNYTTPFNLNTDGNHQIDFNSTDTAGRIETTKTSYCALDLNLTTAITGNSPNWTKVDQNITLTCQDNASGCAATYYNLDNAGWQTYTSSFLITTDLNHILQYYSTTNSGITESTQTAYAAVDKTNPITLISGCNSGWHTSNTTASISATDATSGLKTIYLWDSNGTYQTSSSSPLNYLISTDLNHILTFHSQDNALNQDANQTSYCAVDKTAPIVGSTTFTGFTTYNTYIKGTGNIYATRSDAASGVNQCYYSTNNGSTWITADGNTTHCYQIGISIVNAQTYQFDLNTTDNAGNNAKGAATSSYTGDTIAPTTTLTYLQRTLYSIADVNLNCVDTVSGCKSTRYRIDSNLTWNNYTVPFTITGSGTYTVYFDSNDNIGNQETTTSNAVYISPDIIAPTLSYTIPKTYGFGVDNNIPFTLTCSGDRLDQLWFDVNVDGVSKLHSLDNNGVTKTSSTIVTTSSPSFLFSCTNASGLATTITVQPFTILQFQLVNEATGVLIDSNTIDNNFAIAQVFTIDGNFRYDFKANHRGDVNAILPYSQQLVFNFGYNDAQLTQINRVINGSIEITSPMKICAPLFQQFYEQQFVSYTSRTITLYNFPSSCYELQGNLNYLSSSNYGLTTYTTNKPFYLYTWVGGVKTFFSLIDGGAAQAYNLDVITLTRTPIVYTNVVDGLGAIPLINPVTGNADLNILAIQYRSRDGNNTAVNIKILNGSTVLLNQDFVDANSANAFNLNYNYNGVPGITSATWFTIRTVSTNPNGSNTTTITINAAGNAPTINQTIGTTTFYGNLPIVLAIFAVIISSLFFIFGISIASSGNTFGMFGILVCLGATAICAIAVQVWYVDILISFYVGTILFIMLVGKPRQGMVMG